MLLPTSSDKKGGQFPPIVSPVKFTPDENTAFKTNYYGSSNGKRTPLKTGEDGCLSLPPLNDDY